MQETEVLDRKGKATGMYVYDANGANRALELLGKEIGMFRERLEVGRPGEFERLSRMTDEELDQEEARILNEIEDDHARKRGAMLSVVPSLPIPKLGDGKPLGLLSEQSNTKPGAAGNGGPYHDRPLPGLNPDNGGMT